MSLLTIGSVAYDSIKTPFGSADKALGGSASYFSLSASYFSRPSIVAVVGEDFKPEDEKILAEKNIDLTGLQKTAGKTFAWGGQYSFDMNSRTTLFTELGVFENFKPELTEDHKKSEYIFLGNIHPSLQLEVLSQITSPKLVGLDTMNFWIEKALDDLKKVLAQIDILIINDSEARELSKEHNLIKAAKIILGMMKTGFGRGVPSATEGTPPPTLIIKRGEYGLLMFNGESIFNLPGYPLEDVADPTGAGDSFAGGFMGYLAKTDDISQASLKQACVAGSVMASFCVENLTTVRLQNLRDEDIQKRMENFKHLTHFELN